MVELEFLKLKMQVVASDVEKIPRETRVLETRVPPFSFQITSSSSSVLLLPQFFSFSIQSESSFQI